MKSSLKNLLLIGVALLVLSGCAMGISPTSDMKVVRDVQGTWEGKQFEEGVPWHVFGDNETGYTGSTANMVFYSDKVKFIPTSTSVNPFWSATQKTRVSAGNGYRREYFIGNNGEIIFLSGYKDHKMIFHLEGETLVGGRDDLTGLVWRFQRVTKKEIATEERKIREEPKQEPPTSVSLPTSSGGMGLGFR